MRMMKSTVLSLLHFIFINAAITATHKKSIRFNCQYLHVTNDPKTNGKFGTTKYILIFFDKKKSLLCMNYRISNFYLPVFMTKN